MKLISQITAQILATAVFGIALVKLGNAEFTASLNGEIVLSVVASIAILAFAIADYSHRVKLHHPNPPLLRPALPHGRLCNNTSDVRADIVEHAA